MIFKTLTLEIYKPSRRKRNIIDTSMRNYSKALEWLFEYYKEDIKKAAASEHGANRSELLSILGKDALKEINKFDIQPFKDSIKMEFASIASAYMAQLKKGNAGYPCVTLSDEQYKSGMESIIDGYTAGSISKKCFEKSSASLIAHAGRLHMLYFGRYSKNRDYCLLYDSVSDRFFAKLYMLNYANRIKGSSGLNGKILKYIAPGLPVAEPENDDRRYLVLPLAFGRYQKEQLMRSLASPGILHTARIVRRGGRYFLLLNIECEQGQRIKPVTTIGIARSIDGLQYTIHGKTSKKINISDSSKSQFYAISAEIVKIAVKNRCQVVLESNGGKNDALAVFGETPALSKSQYARLSKILSYKLPEAGLPAPVEVSANGLYNTCPLCGCNTNKNRIAKDIFACIECGYACPTELIGSAGLAARLDKYKKDKIPIYYRTIDNKVMFFNKTLDFECCIDVKQNSFTQLYYELNLLSHSNLSGGTKRKYSMLKKLREASDVGEVIRLVPKSNR